MAQTRKKIPITVIDAAGNALSYASNNAQATIYDRNDDGTANTGSAATVYSSENGATTGQPLQANSSGRLPGWVKRGRYVARVSATGLTTYDEAFDVLGV